MADRPINVIARERRDRSNLNLIDEQLSSSIKSRPSRYSIVLSFRQLQRRNLWSSDIVFIQFYCQRPASLYYLIHIQVFKCSESTQTYNSQRLKPLQYFVSVSTVIEVINHISIFETSCFDKGFLRVKTENETVDISANEAMISPRGQWVQYSTPGPEGAEYIAVCIPAFSPDTVHRDE
ncbi:MAG: hypothetical protein JXB29_07070 [Sedimentisphaerales bacterium]|nr:hypothetical protein [Sedimentisphaerales bacterium]